MTSDRLNRLAIISTENQEGRQYISLQCYFRIYYRAKIKKHFYLKIIITFFATSIESIKKSLSSLKA